MFFELRNHSVISYLAHAGLVHRAEVTKIIICLVCIHVAGRCIETGDFVYISR